LISPEKNSSKEETESLEASTNVNADDFPTEEQYQQNIKKKSASEKPFYTWTDAEGIVRSDVKPDVMVEFTASEIVYDVAFVPPFRLPKHVSQGLCCESYAEHFSTQVEQNGSASFKVDSSKNSFKTQEGEVNAAYFSLPSIADKEILVVKAYEISPDSTFELIALAEDFKPIYLESAVKGSFVEQTWKDLAYKKVMIEASDTAIKHLIVFIKNKQGMAYESYTVSVIRDALTNN